MTIAMFTKSAAAAAGTQRLLGKDDIYVAAVPLRAAKGPPQLLMSAAYSLNLSWDLQHFMVIIKPTSPPQQAAVVFDFQPRDPEDVLTALAVISGRSVPGAVFRRTLKGLPRRRCWYVGSSEYGEQVAAKFSEKWSTYLKVGNHDCRHFTNGLVELLTGEELVLEKLRTNVLMESNTS
ncbi:unnamed protein product [Linum tenue]|uniref:PTB domain-containing engulfment adapter protein 1 n=1 Tax=Linum tenue TaxID=586396 RepID=A0AAV0IGG3_9ROSI|nr:unnamed protein product [Linum tenue]